MEEKTLVREKIVEFASKRVESAVFDPKDGYYPFEIIEEAYAKGIEHGEQRLRNKMKKRYVDNAKLVAASVNKMLKALAKKDYHPEKLYACISIDNSKVLFTIDESTFSSEEFLSHAYSQVSKIQLESHDKGFNIDLNFIVDNLDSKLMESDGFGIALDMKNNLESIY